MEEGGAVNSRKYTVISIVPNVVYSPTNRMGGVAALGLLAAYLQYYQTVYSQDYFLVEMRLCV